MPINARLSTLQEASTALTGDRVLAAACEFFERRSGIYAAFVEKRGPTHLTFRGQGGEEIAIGVAESGGTTSVTASSYLFGQQVARFLLSLPPAASGG